MKTIFYFHQYFKTPEQGGAIRSYYIAKAMVMRGWKVEMIAAHNLALYQKKEIEGINVHYLPVKYSNNMSFPRRYWAFIKFVILAINQAKRISHPDLVYATSTPLTIGIIALWLKWRKQTPYIFEVRDLWPDAPIQMGVIRSSWIKKLAYSLENKIYTYAETIIALSPGIASNILSKSPGSHVPIIPNMSDISFFENVNTSHTKFTIGYFGTFGLANNMEFIIKIAYFCQKQRLPINFLLAGDGKLRKFLEEAIKKFELNNITLLNQKNRHEINDLMNKTDACFTTFLKIPVLETNSPNKFFDGLAAGKLSIVNTKGWLKELVETNECGIYIDPDKPEHFPDLIKPFIRNNQLLKKYQQNGFQLGTREFDREKLVSTVCDEVEACLTRH